MSAFAARVLDQLALSAWLPAALFTGAGALLIQFRLQRSLDVPAALSAISADKLQLLILALPTLVIATLITQAFSFESIRTLEGYWRRRGLAQMFRTIMIKRHVRRKERLSRWRRTAAQQAFAVARPRLLVHNTHAVVNALESQMLGLAPPDMSPADETKVARMTWRSMCDAWDLAKVDQWASQENDYPVASRVLPTKLGNVLRATEDSLTHADQDVEGFALRRRATVSERVQLQHDQFRTRLDMYCTLVFTSGVLTILTVALLTSRIAPLLIALVTTGFLGLAAASYGAAIASARGYGSALKQMDAVP